MQKIDVHGLSLPGDRHDKNQDHFAIASLNKSMRVHQTNLSIDDDARLHGHNQGHLFLVADGISSAPAPARASQRAVDNVVQYFLNELPWFHLADGKPEEVTLALEDALLNSQQELAKNAPEAQTGLATTMTLAFVFWPNLYLAHVGDSRCYLYRKSNGVRQLTTDQDLEELRRELGLRTVSDDAHPLLSSVGKQSAMLRPEVKHVELQSGDVLALITEGVERVESRSALKSVLRVDSSAEELCGELVGSTGSDDRTAIVVRFLPEERVHAREQSQSPPRPIDARRELPGGRRDRHSKSCGTLRRSDIVRPNRPGPKVDAPRLRA